MNSNKYYTIKELSIMFNTPISTLRKCVKKGKIRGCILGGKYLISQLELDNFISAYLTPTNKKVRYER